MGTYCNGVRLAGYSLAKVFAQNVRMVDYAERRLVFIMTGNHVARTYDFLASSPTWKAIDSGLESAGDLRCFDIAPNGMGFLVSYDSENLDACGLFTADLLVDNPVWTLVFSVQDARDVTEETDEFRSVAASTDSLGYVVFMDNDYPTEQMRWWYSNGGTPVNGGVGAGQVPTGLQYSMCRGADGEVLASGGGNYDAAAAVWSFPSATYVKATYGVNGMRSCEAVCLDYVVGVGPAGNIYEHTTDLDNIVYTGAMASVGERRLLQVGESLLWTDQSNQLVLDDVVIASAAEVFGAELVGAGYDYLDTLDKLIWLCGNDDPATDYIQYTEDGGETWDSRVGNWAAAVGDWDAGSGEPYRPMVRALDTGLTFLQGVRTEEVP